VGVLDDFVPIVNSFPRRDVKLYAVADLHVGSREFKERVWQDFAARVLREPDSYLLIVGDMMNNALKNSVSNVYEEVMRPREQKAWLVEQLGPLRDRILCITPGNHEDRSVKEADDNPLYDVACKLDLEDVYRESACFLILRFGEKAGDGKRNPTYTVCATHGAGGGILTGAAVNRNERLAYAIDGLDLLVVAHSHKPWVTQPGKLVVDAQNNRVSVKPFKVAVATAWQEYGGYALKKQMLPAAHALQEIVRRGGWKDRRVPM
jgi:hypothetical protein